MGKPWEDYKEQIHNLYIVQNLPLKSVQEILKREYGFDACKRAFQNQIEAWGFRKNVRSAEMQVYVQQKKLRKSDSEIDLPDETKKIITPRKARRFEKRSETMNHSKGTALDLEIASANAMAHHGLSSPPSATFPQRMTSGHGYQGFPYAQDLTGSGPYGAHSDMQNISSQYRNPHHGGSGYPMNSTGASMPNVTSSTLYSSLPSDVAPMFDLTDDFSYSSSGMYGMPSGIMKREHNEWYLSTDSHHMPSFPSHGSSNSLDEDIFGAVMNGDAKNLEIILSKGGNANATNMEGETAMMYLVKTMYAGVQNNLPMETLLCYNRSLDVLLRHGANMYMRNRLQESPVDFTMTKGQINADFIGPDAKRQWAYFIRQFASSDMHTAPGRNFPQY